MQSNAKIVPISAGGIQPVAAPDSSGFHGSRFAEEAERAARYRLVIEEGPDAGSFIYKTMDRVTGEVIRQLPREQLIDLVHTPEYSAGSVIDTKA